MRIIRFTNIYIYFNLLIVYIKNTIHYLANFNKNTNYIIKAILEGLIFSLVKVSGKLRGLVPTQKKSYILLSQ